MLRDRERPLWSEGRGLEELMEELLSDPDSIGFDALIDIQQLKARVAFLEGEVEGYRNACDVIKAFNV